MDRGGPSSRGKGESDEFMEKCDEIVVCFLRHCTPLSGLTTGYERRIDLSCSQIWFQRVGGYCGHAVDLYEGEKYGTKK